MPDETTMAAFQTLGLTKSEAKIYFSLLGGSAANGNQVSRRAGVPSAKVYENLDRLCSQGLVAQLEDGAYVALDLEEFLSQKRSRLEEVEERLRDSVRRKAHDVHGEILWHGSGYRALLDRAEQLVASAQAEALISAWPSEMEQLLPTVKTALTRGVRVAAIVFTSPTEVEALFGELLEQDGLSIFGHALFPSVHARHGNHAAFVVDEAATLLMNDNALIENAHTEWVGVRTTNQAVVQTVANFIRHDIYLNKLQAEFGDELEAAYGPELTSLLDAHSGGIDRPHETTQERTIQEVAR